MTDEKIQDAFLPEEIFSEFFFLSLTTGSYRLLVDRSMFVNFAATLVDRVARKRFWILWPNFVQFASLEDVAIVCKNIECTYFGMTNKIVRRSDEVKGKYLIDIRCSVIRRGLIIPCLE